MTFILKFDTDSDAFADDPTIEIARILRHVADRVESGEDCGRYLTVFDINGNDVGRFKHNDASLL